MKELQIFSDFRRATRTEFDFFSASVRCANLMASPKLLIKSIVRIDPKNQARGAEMTQILFQILAKIFQNFRNFGAPWAEKMRALGQRALRKSCDVAEAFGEVEIAYGSE